MAYDDLGAQMWADEVRGAYRDDPEPGTCRHCGEPCREGRTEHRACAIAAWREEAGR